ncbi:MAG: YqgE/AlgH family protein [Hyphomicrobiaceae bacterium]|jgi:putative transcriptional regulator
MQNYRKLKSARSNGYLEGQLLIAMPTMTDKRFQRSVIYMCAHSAEGAMGLIINQRASHISFPELLDQLRIASEDGEAPASAPAIDMDIHVGGPVETSRGFVLHSSDYYVDDATMQIDSGINLTATIDVLRALAGGKGPNRAILALGYAGWRAGQLESEIQANGWLHCPADLGLIFDRDIDEKYNRALSKIGIDPSHFVTEAGHA